MLKLFTMYLHKRTKFDPKTKKTNVRVIINIRQNFGKYFTKIKKVRSKSHAQKTRLNLLLHKPYTTIQVCKDRVCIFINNKNTHSYGVLFGLCSEFIITYWITKVNSRPKATIGKAFAFPIVFCFN